MDAERVSSKVAVHERDVQWTTAPGQVDFQWSRATFAGEHYRGLEPWIDELREPDDTEPTRLSLSYTRWAELGAPPAPNASEEENDLFQARHTAVARLLGLSYQSISIESVGHIGAPELSFLLQVDGARIGDIPSPTPFPRDGIGHVRPLMPAAYVVYARLCAWNANCGSTRAEQI